MKIIHSLWSKPLVNATSRSKHGIGGWLASDYFYMSWALSCLTLSKLYPNIELITDNIGYKQLIEKLELPYASVKVELNTLDFYPAALWAIGKIYAYSIQETPFLHVDSDVFLWSRFEDTVENASIVTQQTDTTNGHYKFALDKIANYYTPDCIHDFVKTSSEFRVHNAGIIGGSDIDFFKAFSTKAFEMIERNATRFPLPISGTHYALLYEQLLFSALAHKMNKPVTTLLVEDSYAAAKTHLEIYNFYTKYKTEQKYVHLLGELKKDFKYCHELRTQLELEYPTYLEKIEKLIYDKELII